MIAWLIGGYAFIGVVVAVFSLDVIRRSQSVELNLPPDTEPAIRLIVGLFWPILLAASLVAALWFAAGDVGRAFAALWREARRRSSLRAARTCGPCDKCGAMGHVTCSRAPRAP